MANPSESIPSASADPQSSQNDSGRIRSSRACLHCSRRKVKCDGLQPCNNCSKDSHPCEYGAQKKRGPPKGCEPKGGRRKKVQESPSESRSPSINTAKGQAPPSSSPSSKRGSAAREPKRPRTTDTNDDDHIDKKPSGSRKGANSSASSAQPSDAHNVKSHTDTAGPSRGSPQGRLSLSATATGAGNLGRLESPPHPAIASLTSRSSSDAHFTAEERAAIPPHAMTSSYASHDFQSPWPRSSYAQTIGSSPGPSARHHTDEVVSSNHSANHRAWQPPPIEQHYLQPQHPHHAQQHHSDYHHSDHSWALSGHHYDAHPLQAPSRDNPRSSPLASHRSMPPPHPSTAAPTHSFFDSASHPAPALPPARSNPTASTSTFASPRSYAGRSLFDSPGGHFPSGASPFDRVSSVSSGPALTSRHPVSASRFTEPSVGSTASHGGAHTASTSLHHTGVTPSPAFTGPSHTFSPSSTAMPHRPWYNGSQPSSPRGAASIPRSQISSPGANWLDYHIRPGSAAASQSLPSSRIHLEDRLPPHIVQRLLDIYQVFVHPHWPIIYLPSVTSLHSLKRSRPIVFEAILAVASNTFDAYLDAASEDDQPGSNPVMDLFYEESPRGSEPTWKSSELRDHFVQRVKTRIFEGKFTQDIGTIQAAILISVIELGCGNTSSAFQFGGIACRMALDMNLHRCTQSSSSVTSMRASSSQNGASADSHHNTNDKTELQRNGAQMQERLRVFWACFILDKILSTALDKPAQLRTAEIETDWPSVQEADEYDLWINEVTRRFVHKGQLPRLEGVKVHALSSFKAWAEVMAILEGILEEVYSPKAKRDRRRTQGASDYEALPRLNDRLSKWRADLPAHLKWSGTWTSSDLLSSPVSSQTRFAERKESEPHRGLPPQILTMRAWYCICLILLHRPRVPKLLAGPKDRSAELAEENDVATEDGKEPSTTKNGRKRVALKDKRSEPAGLDICNAAAKEVCDILHAYGTSFRIRKISSSWVYLIFQSATIHAAIAASKSVVAFKARQSSIWSRRASRLPSVEHEPTVNDGQNEVGAPIVEDAEMHAIGGDEVPHVTEAELEGSSELVKTSALYLAECVRYLTRIGPTWQSASNHVAVLRNLCLASAQARPSSPSPVDVPDQRSHHHAQIKDEHHANDNSLHHPGSNASILQHHDPHHPVVPSQNGTVDGQHHSHLSDQHHQHLLSHHGGKDISLQHIGDTSAASATFGINNSNGLHNNFLQPQGHAQDQLLAAAGVTVPHHHHHESQQATVYPINANDSAFWASMPVASEGYNQWDEFFRTFNPSAASTDVASHSNYHPTAALDLITALQDPNRLLNGL